MLSFNQSHRNKGAHKYIQALFVEYFCCANTIQNHSPPSLHFLLTLLPENVLTIIYFPFYKERHRGVMYLAQKHNTLKRLRLEALRSTNYYHVCLKYPYRCKIPRHQRIQSHTDNEMSLRYSDNWHLNHRRVLKNCIR